MFNSFVLLCKGQGDGELASSGISAIQSCGRRDAHALPQGRENKQDTDASAAAGLSTQFTTATQAGQLYEPTCGHCYLLTAPSAS